MFNCFRYEQAWGTDLHNLWPIMTTVYFLQLHSQLLYETSVSTIFLLLLANFHEYHFILLPLLMHSEDIHTLKLLRSVLGYWLNYKYYRIGQHPQITWLILNYWTTRCNISSCNSVLGFCFSSALLKCCHNTFTVSLKATSHIKEFLHRSNFCTNKLCGICRKNNCSLMIVHTCFMLCTHFEYMFWGAVTHALTYKCGGLKGS